MAKLAKPNALVGQADTSKSAKPTGPVGSADSPMTSPVNSPKKLSNRLDITSSDVGADLEDWRTPLLRYLRDPSAKIDKSVRQSVFKYVLHNNELYQELPKICCLSVWDQISQEWLWEKSMKASVVCINWP